MSYDIDIGKNMKNFNHIKWIWHSILGYLMHRDSGANKVYDASLSLYQHFLRGDIVLSWNRPVMPNGDILEMSILYNRIDEIGGMMVEPMRLSYASFYLYKKLIKDQS